jgi:hypothetical protein
MTETEQIEPTDVLLFWVSRGRVSAMNDAGWAGDEFIDWKTGWYWQRRTPGKIEDGFGKPAGEPHGPFKTDARARLDMLLEYRRLAGEQLDK